MHSRAPGLRLGTFAGTDAPATPTAGAINVTFPLLATAFGTAASLVATAFARSSDDGGTADRLGAASGMG